VRIGVAAIALLAALVGMQGSSRAATCTINFDGGPGGTGTAWSVAANWDTDVLPGAADHACIPAGFAVDHSTGTDTISSLDATQGTLTLSGGTLNLTSTTPGDSVAAGFTMTFGTLGGAGLLQLSGTNTWTGGTMDGASAGGTTRLMAGGTLVHDVNSVTLANGRVLEVAGAFELRDNSASVSASGSAPTIHTAATGTMTRTTAAGAGTTFVGVQVDNDGAAHSDAGILNLANGSGGATSTGEYGSAGAGGEVHFGGATHTLGSGATWEGGVELASGGVTIGSGVTVPATGAGNGMSFGTIGGSGTFQIGGGSTFLWTGGTMDGASADGTTRVLGGAILAHDVNSVTLANGRVLEVAGAFELRDNSASVSSSGAASTIHTVANGTMVRTAAAGAGTTFVGVQVDNDGTLESDAGQIDLGGALTNYNAGTLTGGRFVAKDSGDLSLPGLVDVNAAHLVLDGTIAQITSGTSVFTGMDQNAAAGTIELRRGANPTITGPFTNAGTLRFSIAGPNAADFGRLTVTGAANLGGTLAIVTDPAYDPAVGTQFAVLSAGTRNGTFSTVTGNDLGTKHYDVAYGSSAVTLTVAGGPPPPPPPPPADADGDGVLEPQDLCPTVFAKTADGCPLPPPLLGATANVVPVKGEVFVKLPAGAARIAQTKGAGFIPLSEARQIPMGSLLDTRAGTVSVTTAGAKAGQTQAGTFDAGIFQILQSRNKRKKGLTELRLKGTSTARCPAPKRGKRGKGRTAAKRLSKKTLRRLRGNAKGKFQTRGSHSAATVRGTIWTVTDRCDGTLTSVARGSVVVRDFRRKRNVVLKAGKSYLAKAG
jgi:hypothetical protein